MCLLGDCLDHKIGVIHVPFTMIISQALYITPSILLQHSSLKRSFLPFKETTSHSDDKGNGTNLTIDIAVDITVIHMTHALFFRQWYFVCPLFCCLYVYVYSWCVLNWSLCWPMQHHASHYKGDTSSSSQMLMQFRSANFYQASSGSNDHPCNQGDHCTVTFLFSTWYELHCNLLSPHS